MSARFTGEKSKLELQGIVSPELRKRIRRDFPQEPFNPEEPGVLIEHSSMSRPAREHLRGRWEYMAGNGAPIYFGSLRFFADGRVCASRVDRECEGMDWREMINTGWYDVAGNFLRLTISSGREEIYRCDFTDADELTLSRGRESNVFRRPGDIPPGGGNRVGTAALEE